VPSESRLCPSEVIAAGPMQSAPWLLPTIVFLSVAVPKLCRPLGGLLPAMVTFVAVRLPTTLLRMPAPMPPGSLLLIVVLVSVTSPLLKMPPPSPAETLSTMLLPDAVTVPPLTSRPPPFPPAVFPITELLISSSEPLTSKPPAPLPAVFLAIRTPIIVAAEPGGSSTPPTLVDAVLASMAPPVIVNEALGPLLMPPAKSALLPRIKEFSSVAVPPFSMPPPVLREPPVAELATTAVLTSLNHASVRTRMPPPHSHPKPTSPFPLRISRSVAVSNVMMGKVLMTSNIRSSPAPTSIVVLASPAPLIVRLSVTSRSPVAALSSPPPTIVRLNVPEGRLMVSSPGAAFAAMTASRKEQSASQVPSAVSAVFVTVKVAAVAGSPEPANSAAATAHAKRNVRVARVRCRNCGRRDIEALRGIYCYTR